MVNFFFAEGGFAMPEVFIPFLMHNPWGKVSTHFITVSLSNIQMYSRIAFMMEFSMMKNKEFN